MADSRHLTESRIENCFAASCQRILAQERRERQGEGCGRVPQAQQQAHSQTFKAKHPTIPAISPENYTVRPVGSETRKRKFCLICDRQFSARICGLDGGDIDHESVLHITCHSAIITLINVFGTNKLNITGDVMSATEV
jgi:hypothetical protein